MYSALKLMFCCFELIVLFSFAVTTFPVNTTALPCQAANFTCAGTGDFFHWKVNGEDDNNIVNAGRGLDRNNVYDGQSRSSTLIVPANGINENVTVECVIIELDPVSKSSSPPTHLSIEGK